MVTAQQVWSRHSLYPRVVELWVLDSLVELLLHYELPKLLLIALIHDAVSCQLVKLARFCGGNKLHSINIKFLDWIHVFH